MTRLEELRDTTWKGTGVLWMDPVGDEPLPHDCSLTIGDGVLTYRWDFKGESKEGRFELGSPLRWTDSFHQRDLTDCTRDDSSALFKCRCTYGAGDGPDWGWHMLLSERPDGTLVLQMTNVAPWGEEARAVRMIFERQ